MMTSEPVSPTDVWRPPLGFIVEGDSEYQGYHTLMAAGLGYPTGHVPISNAGGAGTLQRNLEDLLDELCRTRHPRCIIVTIDSRDFRKHPELCDCAVLRSHLQDRADLWLQTRLIEKRGFLLPARVVVVIQHPMYEGWLIADFEGLAKATTLVRLLEVPDWCEVDDEVPNPASWLKERLVPGLNPKNPLVLKRLARHLDPMRIAARSRSFRKLWREIQRALAAA